MLFAECEVKEGSFNICLYVRKSVPESTCRTSIFPGSQSVHLYRVEYITTYNTLTQSGQDLIKTETFRENYH